MSLYARSTGTRIHIFHLSSRDGLNMIEEWRAKGVDITCETGGHYVFLKAEDMSRLGSRLRMNPPVRYAGHGDYLLDGLVDGRVTMIATDHSPHTAEEKLNDDIWKAISGFPGVETSVRFFLSLRRQRRPHDAPAVRARLVRRARQDVGHLAPEGRDPDRLRW